MSRLTPDRTAEPVSRDQIFSRERGQGMSISPVQLTMCRIGNLTRLIRTLAICVAIHIYYCCSTIKLYRTVPLELELLILQVI